MKAGKPLAVIDTNVWVFVFQHETLDDFQSKQPYRAILEALEGQRFAPLFSAETLDELEYILTTSLSVARRFNVDVELAKYFIEAITAVELGARDYRHRRASASQQRSAR
jgi:predicted nucleic acid-binding protein